jgi:hypothetical protein
MDCMCVEAKCFKCGAKLARIVSISTYDSYTTVQTYHIADHYRSNNAYRVKQFVLDGHTPNVAPQSICKESGVCVC